MNLRSLVLTVSMVATTAQAFNHVEACYDGKLSWGAGGSAVISKEVDGHQITRSMTMRTTGLASLFEPFNEKFSSNHNGKGLLSYSSRDRTYDLQDFSQGELPLPVFYEEVQGWAITRPDSGEVKQFVIGTSKEDQAVSVVYEGLVGHETPSYVGKDGEKLGMVLDDHSAFAKVRIRQNDSMLAKGLGDVCWYLYDPKEDVDGFPIPRGTLFFIECVRGEKLLNGSLYRLDVDGERILERQTGRSARRR